MRRLSLLTLVAVVSMAALALGPQARATTALWSDQETISASSSTAACFVDDASGPTVTASAVSKTVPYYGGFIRQGGAYHVYANAAAGGGGPVSSVTADVGSLTAGQFLVPLVAGSYSVEGVAYGYRSAALSAGSPLAAGPYTYTVSASDASSLCRTASASVTVDNTAPAGADVQPNNWVGGTPGRPEAGDTIVYTFSEIIDPEAISSGWTGPSRDVVVHIQDNAGNDLVTVWDATNTVQLALGSTDLTQNYVTTDTTFGAAGTPSTMVQSGTTITVTLGTQAGTTRTATQNRTALWTGSAAATDRAGNACSTVDVAEGGAADRNF